MFVAELFALEEAAAGLTNVEEIEIRANEVKEAVPLLCWLFRTPKTALRELVNWREIFILCWRGT